MFNSSKFVDVTFFLFLNCSRALNIRSIKLDELIVFIIDFSNNDDFEKSEYSSTIIDLKKMNKIIVDLKNDEITVELKNDR
jgi:hypothetical protein